MKGSEDDVSVDGSDYVSDSDEEEEDDEEGKEDEEDEEGEEENEEKEEEEEEEEEVIELAAEHARELREVRFFENIELFTDFKSLTQEDVKRALRFVRRAEVRYLREHFLSEQRILELDRCKLLPPGILRQFVHLVESEMRVRLDAEYGVAKAKSMPLAYARTDVLSFLYAVLVCSRGLKDFVQAMIPGMLNVPEAVVVEMYPKMCSGLAKSVVEMAAPSGSGLKRAMGACAFFASESRFPWKHLCEPVRRDSGAVKNVLDRDRRTWLGANFYSEAQPGERRLKFVSEGVCICAHVPSGTRWADLHEFLCEKYEDVGVYLEDKVLTLDGKVDVTFFAGILHDITPFVASNLRVSEKDEKDEALKSFSKGLRITFANRCVTALEPERLPRAVVRRLCLDACMQDASEKKGKRSFLVLGTVDGVRKRLPVYKNKAAFEASLTKTVASMLKKQPFKYIVKVNYSVMCGCATPKKYAEWLSLPRRMKFFLA